MTTVPTIFSGGFRWASRNRNILLMVVNPDPALISAAGRFWLLLSESRVIQKGSLLNGYKYPRSLPQTSSSNEL